jgi:hypothetical protein
LGFYELIEDDLIRVVKNQIIVGRMLGVFNSYFIFIVPKNYKVGSLDDFRPILMCKCIYKIIEKIIRMTVKSMLSQMKN